MTDETRAPLPESGTLTAADYEEALADHHRLVRELDVALNGETGAAKQASLCDIVAQVKRERIIRSATQPLDFDCAEFSGSMTCKQWCGNDECRVRSTTAPSQPADGPTPETEKKKFSVSIDGGNFNVVFVDAARTLERQRDEARRELAALQQLYGAACQQLQARGDKAVALSANVPSGMVLVPLEAVKLAWSIAHDRRANAFTAEADLEKLERAGFAKHLPTFEDLRGILKDAPVGRGAKP